MKRREFIGLTSILFTSSLYTGKSFAFFQQSAVFSKPVYPAFDLSNIPFSYAGSYHTINLPPTNDRLKINTARRSAIPFKWQAGWAFEAYDIALSKGGNELAFVTEVNPWKLELQTASASATVVFYDQDTLAIATRNCALKLIPARNFAWKYPQANGYLLYDNQTLQYSHIYGYDPSAMTFGKEKVINSDKQEEWRDSITFAENSTVLLKMVTEETAFLPKPSKIEELGQKRRQEVEAWMKKMPLVKKEHQSAAQIGWYLFWNLQVAPWGNYTRQSILFSKKSMNMIWSWDICFNALTVVKADHSLAWDQLFAILDKQKEDGLLPDAVNDLMSTYGFNKPPIWGWTAMKMLENTPRSEWKRYLTEFYPKVAKFTEWWYTNRDFNKNKVCEYAHGNDSGWDNATLFDAHLPTESPDLTAHLILQTDALAFIADFLGKREESQKWADLSADQLVLFHQTFVENDQLVYRVLTETGLQTHKSTSLLTRIPLLLGDKLKPAVRKNLVKELKQEGVFLTANGVASEAVNSPKYEPNGYWRGPVWAPSTYLIFDGLLKCGEKELARTIAQRFCDMVSKEATFHENYNALTGKGQYDSGLTWTASDFLLMAAWLASNP